MQILWVRHAEPERVESGTGVPANPPLTAAGVAQAERLAVVARARARRRDRLEPATARARDRGADRGRARPRGRDRRRPRRVRRASRPLHPDGGAARDEGRALDGDGRRAAGRSSAARNPTRSRARVARAVDALVGAHPGADASSPCATAASSTSPSPASSGSTGHSGSTRGTRRSRACSRPGRVSDRWRR